MRTPEEKAAQAAYMREYRKSSPAFRKQQTLREKVRYRALVRLAQRHPLEFLVLSDEERARAQGERTTHDRTVDSTE